MWCQYSPYTMTEKSTSPRIESSIKVKNIMKNNNVATITAEGYGAEIIEGKARILNDEEATNHRVADLFQKKHPWKITFGKRSTQVLVEITPKKIMKA